MKLFSAAAIAAAIQLSDLNDDELAELRASVRGATVTKETPSVPPPPPSQPRPKAIAKPRAAPAPKADKPRADGKRHRASPDEVQKQKDLALETAKRLTAGFSKGDVMRESGASVNLGRALSLLVEEGKLTRKGEKRLARYSIAG